MKNLMLNVKKFLKSEDGPTAVEYAGLFDCSELDWNEREDNLHERCHFAR
jgi:hypothetical protein